MEWAHDWAIPSMLTEYFSGRGVKFALPHRPTSAGDGRGRTCALRKACDFDGA